MTIAASDPLEITAPEPRANPELMGHGEAENILADAARDGRLHHAWLISGARGVGKATLAYRFARWLLAGCAEAGSLAKTPSAALRFGGATKSVRPSRPASSPAMSEARRAGAAFGQ